MQLTIDGRQVEVPEGVSVREAARLAGIEIPGLCDHPDLEPYGGCRLCLVEIEGIRGYPSSCTTPAAEGMRVRTDTPPLAEMRRSILEIILSQHPSGCLLCDRAGRCDEVRGGMRKAPKATGCRYCPKDGRCELQRAAEQVGLDRIDHPRLSSESGVVRGPFFDRDPDLCILCGRCVRVCQAQGSGAISFLFRGFETRIGTAYDRPLEDSGCRFCGACLDLCPTGALAERRARWSGPAERSVKTICPYCSSNCRIEIDAAGGRILRSRGLDCRLCVLGRFGLDFVHHGRLERPMIRRGGRLVEVGWEEAMDYVAESLEGLGPGRVAMLVSGVLSNEALCAAEILAEPAMGCSPVAPDIATCFSIREIVQGPSLAVGDLAETNPAMELALRSAGPVVVSARRTPLSERASFWIRPQPGEEAAALEALAEASLGKKMRASPDQEEIWRASRTLGGGAVIIGPDCDGDVRRAGGMLAEAVGGRLCLVGRSCNSMGSAALGLHRGYEEALCSLRAGGLRAAYIAGLNPAREDPSLSACLSGLELLVVQDLFLTETAALADAVLPASSFAEIDGTITSSDGRMLQLSPALPTIGRPDAQILSDLCRRLGIRGPEDPSALQAEASRRIQRGISEAHFQADLAAPSRSASERDSYMLIKGPSLFSFGSSTRTSRVHDLRYLADKRRVTIHPQDARDLGIVDGQTVTLETASMGIQARCRISMAVPRGSLYLPGGDGRATGVRVRPNV